MGTGRVKAAAPADADPDVPRRGIVIDIKFQILRDPLEAMALQSSRRRFRRPNRILIY